MTALDGPTGLHKPAFKTADLMTALDGPTGLQRQGEGSRVATRSPCRLGRYLPGHLHS